MCAHVCLYMLVLLRNGLDASLSAGPGPDPDEVRTSIEQLVQPDPAELVVWRSIADDLCVHMCDYLHAGVRAPVRAIMHGSAVQPQARWAPICPWTPPPTKLEIDRAVRASGHALTDGTMDFRCARHWRWVQASPVACSL